MRTRAPLLAPIFRSESQARLLTELLLLGSELSITGLSKATSISYATVHDEVAKLLDSGILRSRSVGRTRLVSANPESPLTEPLTRVLAIATGPAVLLAQELGGLDGIESAFLYGSFAARLKGVEGPAPRDIDVMVVGDVDAGDVYRICNDVEPTVGRPVNPTILTSEEIEHDATFIESLKTNPVVPLVGDLPRFIDGGGAQATRAARTAADLHNAAQERGIDQ